MEHVMMVGQVITREVDYSLYMVKYFGPLQFMKGHIVMDESIKYLGIDNIKKDKENKYCSIDLSDPNGLALYRFATSYAGNILVPLNCEYYFVEQHHPHLCPLNEGHHDLIVEVMNKSKEIRC